jgi:hypothetical protein
MAAGMSMMAAVAFEGMLAMLVRAVEHRVCVKVMSVSHVSDIDLDISDVKIQIYRKIYRPKSSQGNGG